MSVFVARGERGKGNNSGRPRVQCCWRRRLRRQSPLLSSSFTSLAYETVSFPPRSFAFISLFPPSTKWWGAKTEACRSSFLSSSLQVLPERQSSSSDLRARLGKASDMRCARRKEKERNGRLLLRLALGWNGDVMRCGSPLLLLSL